jgi:HEAT repeat protein
LELLKQGLTSEDYVQAAAAVRSAQEMAGSEVTAALTAHLGNLSTDLQVLVIDTLAYRGDVAALPALQRVVSESEPAARQAAVKAMAGMQEPEVVPVLVEWVQHADSAIASASRESLAALRFPGVDAAVMAMVNSADPERRLIGLELVGRRYMVEALPALLRVAEGNEGEVRVAALRRIGELGTSTELTSLLGLLVQAESSSDRDALEQALTAIAARTSPSEVVSRPVIASLAKSNPAAQAVLLRVLGVAGGADALKQVRVSVGSEHPEVHTAALRTLSTWKTVDAAPELLALAKDSEKPADRALSLRGFLTWVRNSDLAVAQRLSMSADVAPLIQSGDEKKQFLGAVGSIPSERALVYVTPHLGDEAIKEEAAAAVASIAEPRLKRPTSPQANKDLTSALKQAVESNPSDGLKNRLQALLKEAQER